jgi:hypothetical protein
VREKRKTHNILIGKVKGRDHRGDLHADGRIILKMHFKMQDARL